MSIFSRFSRKSSPIYDRYLFAGKSEKHVLWERTSWLQIEPILDELYSRLAAPPRVVATLLDDGLKQPVNDKKINWSLTNNRKWVLDAQSLASVKYVTVQIEGPSVLYCEKNNLWQDLFVEMAKPYRENYNQVIHIAVGPKFQGDPLIDELIRKIDQLIDPVFKGKSSSYWIEKGTESKYIDAFLSVGFNYENAHLEQMPDIQKLDGNWEYLET